MLNGTVVSSLSTTVNPIADVVTLDGQRLTPHMRRVVYLLNKPRGVVSTAADEQGRPGVTDLVPAQPRVFPVGRLDRDSEGLMILTNDGELALRLTHPRYHHQKVYQVWTSTPREVKIPDLLNRLGQPSRLAGRLRRFQQVQYLGRESGQLRFEVIVEEGLKHLVRRLLDRAGLETKRLVRVAHGPLQLGSLQSGTWREPTSVEWLEVEKLIQ